MSIFTHFWALLNFISNTGLFQRVTLVYFRETISDVGIWWEWCDLTQGPEL